MNAEQKRELISRVESEHGVQKLFIELGMKDVTSHGKNVYCVCPFHKGADNSTAFSYSNGFGFCFTQCNKKYDLFDIVMQTQGCTFPEAAEYLAELVGMDIDIRNSRTVSHDGAVNREFIAQMNRVKRKRKVVQWTPISPDIVNGFIPSLHKKLRNEGSNNETLKYFGLGFAQFGYLENRITIPIDYIDGSIVTVAGRSVLSDDEIRKQNIRRYQVWYDTEKSVTLYNISRAEPYIEITGEVIVVEGYKSVWRLHQWDIRNVVAVMGSSLSEEQRKLLLKMRCRIIICGDRDEAGGLLNSKVKNAVGKLAEVEVMDMFDIKVPEHSSLDNITKEQFAFLYKNKK